MKMLPFSCHTLILIAGIVEIMAGALVLVRPRIRAWLVIA